jgi:hypothetical protein
MQGLSFPISASYFKYLLWYDNKWVGLSALKKLKDNEFTYSLN